ncbi:hypothetical protein GGI04_002028 [Coemansia thaxteri]|uniref:m7GpppX diphosphatase n=1 Tax=Coemansia thaxteri TaxID=2663907 RepID=A0A9W8BKN2_9FUNG|nr:hypothetical protein H4R26_002378 [Coemansia thaxteri]KAJ2006020.1 hypothetical protein GGI04_002028 [Coemansia thaxteri]
MTAPAELEGLLRRFRFKEVLSNDTSSKTIWLLGIIASSDADEARDEPVAAGQNAAVVVLERMAFSPQAIALGTGSHDGSAGTMLLGSASLVTGERNDIYSWATGVVDADVLRPDMRIALTYPATQKHIDKHRRQLRRWIRESPELYARITRPFIDSQPASRIQWVYNILSKHVESEHILFEDPDPEHGFVILPDLKWDAANTDNMYLVAIVHRHDLKSLRDLSSIHLPLLHNIRSKAAIAAQKYGVPSDQLRLYIHYQPSYYHLHVHITNVMLEGKGMLAGRAHLLDGVIDNISNIAADYYQRATLSFVLGSSDELWTHWPNHPQPNPC